MELLRTETTVVMVLQAGFQVAREWDWGVGAGMVPAKMAAEAISPAAMEVEVREALVAS